MDIENERSHVEILVLLIIKLSLCVVTLVCLIRFIKEALRHSKLQGEERDIFTIATFVLLTIS